MRRKPARPTAQTVHLPAPVGGLNTVSAGTAMPEGDCPLLFNMLSGEHGLRVRLGSREYAGYTAVGQPGDTLPARTMIGYQGSVDSADKLFAVTINGIWDCTAGYGVASTHSITFALTGGRAGFGTFTSFVTAAGHFLLYCDEENGLHIYTESTATWAKVAQGTDPAQITGVNPANLCFVMSWKSRVWFVEKDSTNAWYLSAGAIYGTATSLNLDRSAQFRRGGTLVGLWNWTLDGGVGIDDHLVAISSGGDVAIYKGSDPAGVDTFALSGVWNAGALVSGRKIATDFGGDLLILTQSGPRPLSQLVSGQDGSGTYAAEKVGNLFSRLARDRGNLAGWEMWIHPDEHALFINVPIPGAEYSGLPVVRVEHLAMSLWNRSWTYIRDLDMSAVCTWRRKVYFSSSNQYGYACLFTSEGGADLVPATTGLAVYPIQWSVITPFKSNGKQVKVELIRPTIISQDGNPAWTANARYNYNLSELTAVSLNTAAGAGSWDVGTWDSALWQSDLGNADTRSRGATGMGSDVAITLRGASTSRTVLVGVDVVFNSGGFL